MAWKTQKYEVKGVSPLIMHNVGLSDPHNPFYKQLKEHTGKRNKTDADLLEIERIEFLGSLYYNDKNIYLPARVIEATLYAAAAKTREKTQAKAGMYVMQDGLFQYNGERDPKKLWEDERFHFRQMVVVGGKRVPRMRTIFYEWGASFVVHYEDGQLNVSRLNQWVDTAGKFCGFCECRPKYGRFEVV